MPKTKVQKQEVIRNIKEKISRAKSVIFTKFDQLGVKENEELRNKLRAEQSEYYVAKKTLFDLAFKDEKIEGLNPKELSGRMAAVFGYDDEIAPAKTVDEFRKGQEEKIEFLGGILENKFIDAETVTALAKLPSKLELRAKFVGAINAPISGFVNALAGNMKNLVYVLSAIKEKKS